MTLQIYGRRTNEFRIRKEERVHQYTAQKKSTPCSQAATEPPSLLRGESQDGGQNPYKIRLRTPKNQGISTCGFLCWEEEEETYPHLFMFQELKDDVPEVFKVYILLRLGFIRGRCYSGRSIRIRRN